MKKLITLLLIIPFFVFGQDKLFVKPVEYINLSGVNERLIYVCGGGMRINKTYETFWEESKNQPKKEEDFSDGMSVESFYSSSFIREFFDVNQFATVSVFDESGKSLGKAKYLNTVIAFDGLGSLVLHEFLMEKDNQSPSFIMNDRFSYKKSKYKFNEFKDNQLSNSIYKEFVVMQTNENYTIKHYKQETINSGIVYSVIQCNSYNEDLISRFLKTENGKTSVLHSLYSGYCIYRAVPVSVFINDHPIFIGHSGAYHSYPDIWIIK